MYPALEKERSLSTDDAGGQSNARANGLIVSKNSTSILSESQMDPVNQLLADIWFLLRTLNAIV